jgi:divalent metal cation (Fe/Co/Zn/Cd) transporter
VSVSADRRRSLGRRARMLAGASVAYNAVEAVVAIGAGAASSSIALVGFGLDSVIEMSSGLVILWQFGHSLPEAHERRALRMIALSFFALAAYVAFESVRSLTGGTAAEHSTPGIVIAALSLAIMPVLSWAQRRTGRALGSNAVVADATQTLLCTYLSGVVLLGLLMNSLWGWWWADPVVGLVVAGLAIHEGVEAFE